MQVVTLQNTPLLNNGYRDQNSVELTNNSKEQHSSSFTKDKSSTEKSHKNHKAQIREYNKISTGFSEETLKRLEQISQKDRKHFTPGAFVDLWF